MLFYNQYTININYVKNNTKILIIIYKDILEIKNNDLKSL